VISKELQQVICKHLIMINLLNHTIQVKFFLTQLCSENRVNMMGGKASALDHPKPDKIDHPWPELDAFYSNIYDNYTLTGQMWSTLPAFPTIQQN
jgi:hypothetical protein